MSEKEELSIDEILASIRNILWDQEVQKSTSRSCIRDYEKERQADVFELTPQMLAKDWDVPYEYANWDFNDVAARMLRKYSQVFALEEANDRKKVLINRNS